MRCYKQIVLKHLCSDFRCFISDFSTKCGTFEPMQIMEVFLDFGLNPVDFRNEEYEFIFFMNAHLKPDYHH